MANSQIEEIDKFEQQLHVCERDIEAIDLNNLDQLPRKHKLQTLSDYILLANTIVTVAINCLEIAAVTLPLPLSIVLHFLTKVIKIYFEKDVASIVIKFFCEMMSDELATRCRARCQRITYCVIYVQNMPDTDDKSKIMSELQKLASNFPLDNAFAEVVELGDIIKRMTRNKEFKDFKELAFYFQLYCALTTYIELFLLQRIAVMSKYCEDASSIKAILEAHRAYDKDVLKVLYSPTKNTVALYINCDLDNSPDLKAFLTRRRLLPVCELDRNTRANRDDYTIVPFTNKKKCVAHKKRIFGQKRELVILNRDDALNNGTNIFQFRKQLSTDKLEQAYCIYVSCDQKCGSGVFDSGYVGSNSNDLITSETDTHRWNVLKIFPESDSEIPAYMISLVEDGSTKFLRLNRWNNVRLASFSQPVEMFLWNIHVVMDPVSDNLSTNNFRLDLWSLLHTRRPQDQRMIISSRFRRICRAYVLLLLAASMSLFQENRPI